MTPSPAHAMVIFMIFMIHDGDLQNDYNGDLHDDYDGDLHDDYDGDLHVH